MSNSSSEDKQQAIGVDAQLFKACPFAEASNASKTYFCYQSEVCCPQGCCSVFSYKYFQNWHFWVIALLIFACFYMLGKYCKKLEKQRLAIELYNNNNNNNSSSNNRNNNRMSSRNRRVGDNPHGGSSSGNDLSSPHQGTGNVNNLLEHFLLQYNQRRCSQCPVPKDTAAGEPPPMYNVALNMPKPTPKPVCVVTAECELHRPAQTDRPRPRTAPAPSSTAAQEGGEDSVPSYEDATGMTDEQRKDDAVGGGVATARSSQNVHDPDVTI